MAAFLTDLVQSIFTPGPTPTLLVATNAAFAALQALLLALLIATYSIHFIILSFLCGGLWWAINWFATEIRGAAEKEAEGKKLRGAKMERDSRSADDSGTETEGAERAVKKSVQMGSSQGGLKPVEPDDLMRKRRSLGEVSGTDSEWDKVENEDSES
ncbi:hypothetical protein MMC30_005711 [Trapelia coarctata]|nr:hypothetical protein [Trapelia coarctata]